MTSSGQLVWSNSQSTSHNNNLSGQFFRTTNIWTRGEDRARGQVGERRANESPRCPRG